MWSTYVYSALAEGWLLIRGTIQCRRDPIHHVQPVVHFGGHGIARLISLIAVGYSMKIVREYLKREASRHSTNKIRATAPIEGKHTRPPKKARNK